MARLLKKMDTTISNYRDRRFRGNQEEFDHCLRTSTTVYVGNLSFYSTEEQVYEAFSKCGDIKRIIMGLHQQNKTPCGFCFVVFYTREDTEDCVKYINGTTLDDRPIRVDFDWGFQEGRQFGRGASGGQVRDEYRMEYDEDRGGFGQIIKEDIQMAHMGSPRVPQGGGWGRRQRDAGTPKERYERGPPAKRQRTVGGGGGGGAPPRSGGGPPDAPPSGEGREPQRNPRFRDDDSDNED